MNPLALISFLFYSSLIVLIIIGNAYKPLIIHPEGKTTLERTRQTCDDNSKWLWERRFEGVEWIYLAQDRSCLRAIMYTEPSGSIKGGEFLQLLGVLLASEGLGSLGLLSYRLHKCELSGVWLYFPDTHRTLTNKDSSDTLRCVHKTSDTEERNATYFYCGMELFL
jgi:hypothetical protein